MWSWDITKLRGPQRGVYYDLYVILDIYSRYVVGWTVAAREDAGIACALIADASRTHGAPASLHADRHVHDLHPGRTAARGPRRLPHPQPTPRLE